ncbi:hydrogenase expression/formation protein HypD [Nitrosomonas aestuarii]|uniref:Hydrogenase maturation factor n=1 Tax=Nitrosomonas aestuarii TaxID=52441 RepID=A0A1I4EDQ3_9PROT|nr:hydrogenase formation protein HypD [Nitrosomonas aestuarii]SFL03090.1 hydrogenase expression/formation protein HypD [Nitrosomonas aestuarii]
MKYIDAFRDGTLARKIAHNIAVEADPCREYSLMEFCGGHTHAISRYGIVDLLPDNIHMIHGPGCPVCVLPMGKLENMIQLAQTPGLILCSYGDMLRVPAAGGNSLLKIKAQGCDIRMIYSSADVLKIAQLNPQRQVVFLAIGFETTTPPTAVIIKQAQALGLTNFTVFCNHVLTPSAISHILQSPEIRQLGLVQLDGFIGPAHVSTVIGSEPYRYFAEEFQKPVVIAGFEPLDVMQAILMLIRQLNAGRAEVENEFTRAVLPDGNLKAQLLVAEVFELRRSFEWRGLGLVPYSALRIKSGFADFDAEQRFDIPVLSIADNKACECGAILRGVKHPRDCEIFGTACTPENPIGSCMVSSEGACAAYYRYGRFRESRPGNTVTKN